MSLAGAGGRYHYGMLMLSRIADSMIALERRSVPHQGYSMDKHERMFH
jgi:hypothetical protein